MNFVKSQRVTEALKTALICLLFLCTVALSALYFYRSGFLFSPQNTVGASSDNSSDAQIGTEQFDGLIMPEAVAVKPQGKHTYAITQGEGYMQLIYRQVCKNISVALSNKCTAAPADSAVWEAACAEDDFILVKYHAPLSHTVIFADAASSLGEGALKNGLETNIGAVDQIFIFPDKTGTGDVFAMTRSFSGEVFTLTLNEDTNEQDTVKSEDFELYVNASAMTLADLYSHVGSRPDVLCSTVLHSYDLNTQKIVFSSGYTGIIEDTDLCGNVATFFDINPDKSGNYYDEKTKNTVFVATHGSLHIGENGISYSAAGDMGGIPLSNYSDIFSAGGIDLLEAIVIAQQFIGGFDDLDRRFLGDDAHPVLSAVYSDKGTVTLEYIYCYSNVEIEGSGTACRLSLKNGKIVKFDAESNIYAASEGGESRHSLSPEWVLDMSLPQIGDSLYTLKYRYRTSDMFAEWIAVKIK